MGVDANRKLSFVSDSYGQLDRTDGPQPAGAKSELLPGPPPGRALTMLDRRRIEDCRTMPSIGSRCLGRAATNHEPAQFQHKLGFGTAPGQIPDYPLAVRVEGHLRRFSTGKCTQHRHTARQTVLQMIPTWDTSSPATSSSCAPGLTDDGQRDDTPSSDPNMDT